MSARCPSCRGSGFTFDRRTNHGQACTYCAGTGEVPSAQDVPPAVRAQVRGRSGGVCEVCHQHPATDQHHRQYRSRGGQHVVENLIDICGPGNAFGCHADAHGPEPLEGVAVSQWNTRPLSEIPFTDKDGRFWVLHRDGTKSEAVPTSSDPYAEWREARWA